MRRKQFLRDLKEGLKKRRDIGSEEVLFYYDELIQDAVDNGEDEDRFISNLGSIKEIIRRIEDDELFVEELKDKNENIVKNALSSTVKIIGYVIVVFAAGILGIISFSLFMSGLGVILGTIVKILSVGTLDLYGYLAISGVILIGISLIIFSIGLVKWFIEQLKPALLSIFRIAKDFLNRKGK